MASKNDTIGKTFTVVLLLCLVCSIIVSGAAVGLKDRQEANAALAMQRNVLMAANIDLAGRDVQELFAERVRTIRVNLDTLETSNVGEAAVAEAADTDTQADVAQTRRVPSEDDIAGVREMQVNPVVYVVYEDDGESVKAYVLPVRGAGLWGMMYALLAIADDGQTIVGLHYYEHGETPGLGGEIQNPRWASSFEGKKAVEDDGGVAIRVTKNANPDRNEVDALSGATITSDGVDDTFQFWLSEKGFGPFLAKVREEGAK